MVLSFFLPPDSPNQPAVGATRAGGAPVAQEVCDAYRRLPHARRSPTVAAIAGGLVRRRLSQGTSGPSLHQKPGGSRTSHAGPGQQDRHARCATAPGMSRSGRCKWLFLSALVTSVMLTGCTGTLKLDEIRGDLPVERKTSLLASWSSARRFRRSSETCRTSGRRSELMPGARVPRARNRLLTCPKGGYGARRKDPCRNWEFGIGKGGAFACASSS